MQISPNSTLNKFYKWKPVVITNELIMTTYYSLDRNAWYEERLWRCSWYIRSILYCCQTGMHKQVLWRGKGGISHSQLKFQNQDLKLKFFLRYMFLPMIRGFLTTFYLHLLIDHRNSNTSGPFPRQEDPALIMYIDKNIQSYNNWYMLSIHCRGFHKTFMEFFV